MAKPLISLVCGTYQRLASLQRMIESVQSSLPPTFNLEIIIVDNASNDGTWQWLESQKHIVKIQMGKPVGAITAFTEGCYSALGDYVLMATDDIYFPPHAITRALVHLETTPLCGAVTFMHNKNRDSFQADYAPVVIDGRQEMKPYTQIALVRRELGDACGWWGGRHPVMKDGFTYGGDNFLSSGIWQKGYTVDTVEGAINYEDVFEDTPRKMNKERHSHDSQLFFSIFPKGGIVPSVKPKFADRERLRILFLMHYSPKHPNHRIEKRGIREGFQEYGIVYDYDFAGEYSIGKDTHTEIRRITEAFKPHLIFCQFHNPSNGISEETTLMLRRIAPTAVMINWNGDVWTKNVEHVKTQNMLAPFDILTFTTWQLCQLATEKTGVPSFYVPNYFEPVDKIADMPSYDVLFTGTAYTPERLELMKLIKALPYKTGIYGNGTTEVQIDGNTHYEWATTCGLYKNAKLIISDQQFQDAHGYVSNRLWESMSVGGGLCLQQHAPRLDELTGLKAGIHYVEWHNYTDLTEKIHYYLAHPFEAQAIVSAAYEFAQREANCLKRVQQYFEGILWLSRQDLRQKAMRYKQILTA